MDNSSRQQPTEAPPSLVGPDGQPCYGIYNTPFKNVNLEDSALEGLAARLPTLYKPLRLKQWQHYAVITPHLFIGLAMVKTGYLGLSWCSIVDRETNRHFEHGLRTLPGRVRIARELWDDRCRVLNSGYVMDIHNHLDLGVHEISLRIDASQGRPSVSAELRCLHDIGSVEPLVAVMPVGHGRAAYTHKVPLPVMGSIDIGDTNYRVEPEESQVLLDVHKAFYPWHTWWRWATFAGRDPKGRRIAVNLTHNVNTDDARYHENAIWIDGRMQRLSPASFNFRQDRILDDWHLNSAGAEVDLTFRPRGKRAENLNLGLVRSSFQQPWGTFRGSLYPTGTGTGSEEIPVEDLFGVCEDHDSYW